MADSTRAMRRAVFERDILPTLSEQVRRYYERPLPIDGDPTRPGAQDFELQVQVQSQPVFGFTPCLQSLGRLFALALTW